MIKLYGNFTVRVHNKYGELTAEHSSDNTIGRVAMAYGFLHTMAATPYTNGHTWNVGFMSSVDSPLVPTLRFTQFTEVSTFLPRILFNPLVASGGGFTGSTTTYIVSWDSAVHTTFESVTFEGLFLTNNQSTGGTLWSSAPLLATIVTSNGDRITVDYTCGSSLSTVVY